MSTATLEDDMEAWEDLNPRARGLGPSDVHRCRAFLGYREAGMQPDPDYDADDRAATVGSLIHEALTARRRLLYPDDLHEYEVAIPGLDRKGRVDLFKVSAATVNDTKTKGLYAFDRVAERGRPYDQDRAQVNVYAFALADEGHVVKECEVTYLNRSNGHELTFSWPFDANEAAADLSWLLGVQDAIDNGYELPRDGRGPGLGFPCDWCPFARTCWGTDRVPSGRTAQSALVVTDADVVNAAREFLEAKEAKAAAEKDYKAAQAALVGLGGAQLILEGQRREVRWGKVARWEEPDPDAMVALLEGEGLPVPKRERTRSGALTIPVVKT